MNMRPGAPNRATPSPDSNVVAPQADPGASSHLYSDLNAGPNYAGNNISGPHTRFFTQDGKPLEQDVPPPLSPFTDSAALPFPAHEVAAEYSAQAVPSHTSDIDPRLDGTTWLQQDPASPADPFAAHYPEFGAPDGRHYSSAYAPGAGNPPEDAPVSSLHITLIVTILLAGLALGIGRAWWIDDKLEAASAKKSVVAASSSRSDIEDSLASIQASIDRAYISPMHNADSGTQKQEKQKEEKLAGPAIDPGPVNEQSASTTAPQAQIQSAQPPQLAQPAPPQDPPEALDVRETASEAEDEIKAAPSRPEQSEARQEKKRRPNKESSKKLASAGKKERISEIDRVRTQAYSETSKDRINERKPASPDSAIGPQSQRRSSLRTKKVAQKTVTNSQYARCERINHIIRREQCKWELCNNKWGKGACPSFKQENPFLF